MPAYLARPFLTLNAGRLREREALMRHFVLARVADAADLTGAMDRLRATGVRWYVYVGDAGPRWDPQRLHAAFADGMVAVYSAHGAFK
jgi:hypothetical protein